VKSTRLLSWLTFLLVAIVLAACSTSPVPQLAAQVAPSTGTASEPTSVGGVTPYIIEGASPGGNRTCAEVGLAFFGDANYYNGSTARVDYPGGSSFTVDGITVTVTNGTYVAFDSPYPIGAVIVKGSDDANVYVYDPQVSSDSGLASPLNASGNPSGLSNITFCYRKALAIEKDAETEFSRTWTWDIVKSSEATEVTLDRGQSYTVNYSVTLSATSEDHDYNVSGEIRIINPWTEAATITSIVDTLDDGTTATITSCTIDGVEQDLSGDITLPGGKTLVCRYEANDLDSADLPTENEVVVTTSGSILGGSATADVEWSDIPATEIDECIEVVDDLYGDLGTVCADDEDKTFEYSLDVGTLATECGEQQVTNTATGTTNDTGTEVSDSHTVVVTVECVLVCPLTQGYWKTHSKYGPAPYDDTWNGREDNPFFSSGKTWYQTLWTPPHGNAYWILAHQYIAATLNLDNGAVMDATTKAAYDAAKAWFETSGNTPTKKLSRTERTTLLRWATLLDTWNNSGDCDEDHYSLL
jgi:hypothetical protein